MFIILVLLLVYLLLKRYWLVSLYLVAVYAVMMFFALLLHSTDNMIFSHDSVLSGSIFLVILLSCLSQFIKSKPKIHYHTSDEFVKDFCLVGTTVSVLLIIGMIFLAPYVLKTIAFGLVNARNAMYEGESYITSYNLTGHIGHSILRWFGWLGYVNLIMCFYAIVSIPKKLFLKLMLFVSSFGSVWIGLLNGGRTYVIYWILFFFFCLFLFYDEFTFQKKRRVYLILIISILVLYRYFAFMTAERVNASSMFSSSEDFLVNYAGQPYSTFIYYFEECTWHPYNFRRIFPLITSFIFGRFNLTDYRSIIFSHNNVNVNGFSTFMGDVFVDVGLVGLILFAFVFTRIANRIMKRESFGLSQLIYLGIIIQIPLFGVFYYSFYKMEVTVSIIIAILIARYLDPNVRTVRFVFGKKS